MSLDRALSNSTSGLKVAQQLIATASGNITNYRTENYAARQVDVISQGDGNGVEIAGISRKVNQFFSEALRTQNSTYSYTSTINSYYENIQLAFGTPNTNTTLDYAINDFFSSVKALSTSPEYNSLRFNTISKAENLTNNISSLARNLQNLRLQADKDLGDSVTAINQEIGNLHNINTLIVNIDGKTDARANLLQKRDDALIKLSEKINIKIYEQDNGKLLINTNSGIPLLSEDPYILDYSAAPSIDIFIKNMPTTELKSYLLNSDGTKGDVRTLISAGVGELNNKDTNIISVINEGEIAALKELRDSIIPKILDQLDNLAAMISKEFNKIHNSGSGFPPLSVMTGTRPIYLTEERNYSGNVRIGIVNAEGKPVKKPDGTNLNPLLMNLSSIKSGAIAGQSNIQTLINEINQYFFDNATSSTTKLGNIDDIKIAASAPLSSEPNGVFTFNFELENNSQLKSDFEVLGITVTDSGCAGLVGALPISENSEAGTRSRTSNNIAVDFAGGSGGPYTIQAQLKITDANGLISTSVIDYQVDDNPGNLNIENTRYLANAATGNGDIISAGTVKQYAQAQFVDKKGNPVTDNKAGYLQIKTLQENFYLSIDELNSNEDGFPATINSAKIPATNKGFSEYFELNDLFVRNIKSDPDTGNASISGTAINLTIRKDIVQNPNLISLGRLTQTQSYPDTISVGAANSRASLRFNNNPSINDNININGVVFTFVSIASADNQITIGATLSDTLDNIIAKLNAVNPTTNGNVNSATYSNNAADTIFVTYKNLGTAGNSFALSGNFATISASINNNIASTHPTGNLEGGYNKDVTTIVTPWSYGLGKGNNSAIKALANLANSNFNFTATGGLPASYDSFSGYITNIVSYNATQANVATNENDKQQLLHDAYQDKIDSVTGVNIDEELINIKQFQLYYSASAKVISVTQELYQTLLGVLK